VAGFAEPTNGPTQFRPVVAGVPVAEHGVKVTFVPDTA
jgi:NAD+--asparagine ADP-ribosyltransferase